MAWRKEDRDIDFEYVSYRIFHVDATPMNVVQDSMNGPRNNRPIHSEAYILSNVTSSKGLMGMKDLRKRLCSTYSICDELMTLRAGSTIRELLYNMAIIDAETMESQMGGKYVKEVYLHYAKMYLEQGLEACLESFRFSSKEIVDDPESELTEESRIALNCAFAARQDDREEKFEEIYVQAKYGYNPRQVDPGQFYIEREHEECL